MNEHIANPESTQAQTTEASRQTYQTPMLKKYGEIASVVKNNSGQGNDGGAGFPNDTLS